MGCKILEALVSKVFKALLNHLGVVSKLFCSVSQITDFRDRGLYIAPGTPGSPRLPYRVSGQWARGLQPQGTGSRGVLVEVPCRLG
jgi:hypothetical protein